MLNSLFGNKKFIVGAVGALFTAAGAIMSLASAVVPASTPEKKNPFALMSREEAKEAAMAARRENTNE